jgi:DNA modification methylase
MGSGAIGVAAKQCGRNFIGIEMNEDYYKMTKERIYNQSESILSFM